MRNHQTTNARLENFEIVDACLRENQIPFDRKQAIPLIVTEARGAASGLLLKIKRAKELQDNPPPKPPPPSTFTVRPKDFKRHPMTDWGLDDFFLKTMETVGTHNFNKLDETIHLRHFHESQRKMEREQSELENTADAERKQRTKVRIAGELQRARDRAAFMDRWIEEGRQSWEINEQKRIESEKMRLRFELAVVAKREAVAENQRLIHAHDGKTGVTSFERNMKRLGVGNNDADPSEQRPSHESGLNYLERLEDTISEAKLTPEGNHELMENLKRAEKVNKKARKERETRRRKMLVDQSRAQAELEKKEAYSMMMEGLAETSRKMRESAQKSWEQKKMKEIESSRRDKAIALKVSQRVDTQENFLRAYFEETASEMQNEENKKKKEGVQKEIQSIKAEAKKKKRHNATAAAETAVSKLLDAVEVICTEREAQGGPVLPQFWRDVKKRFVSAEPFYEQPAVEKDEEWTLLEESEAYIEGFSWIRGDPERWGHPDSKTPPPAPKSSLLTFESSEYDSGVKAILCGMSRDKEAVSDYVRWTLYEYASFLRRDDENWDDVCMSHKNVILNMPTHDNTDLGKVEDAIDVLEEALGDVAEERADSSRDVCDGSAARAKDWISDVTMARSKSLETMCALVISNAVAKLNYIKASSMSGDLASSASANEEEAGAKIEGGNSQEEGEQEQQQQGHDGEEEDEEARQKRLEREENMSMNEEETVERSRLSEIKRRTKLKITADAVLPSTFQALNDALASSPWLKSAASPDALSTFELAESLQSQFICDAFDDVNSYYNVTAAMSEMVNLLIRISFRNDTLHDDMNQATSGLLKKLDEMCKRRAKFEADCIVELAARIGDAASTSWKSNLKFAVDLSKDDMISRDADYPGVVFDTRGKKITVQFLRQLAKRLKSTCKQNTISLTSFIKVVQRSVEDMNLLPADKAGWGWTDAAQLKSAASLMDPAETGRLPWKLYIHLLCCHFLPSLPTLEALKEMTDSVKAYGTASPALKKDGFLCISKSSFMSMRLWFETAKQPTMDEDLAKNLKEVYASAFACDNDSVEFTEILLAWSSVKKSKGQHSSHLGLLRAMTAISGNIGRMVPGVSKCGPKVTEKELENLLAFNYAIPPDRLDYTVGLFERARKLAEEETEEVVVVEEEQESACSHVYFSELRQVLGAEFGGYVLAEAEQSDSPREGQ